MEEWNDESPLLFVHSPFTLVMWSVVTKVTKEPVYVSYQWEVVHDVLHDVLHINEESNECWKE